MTYLIDLMKEVGKLLISGPVFSLFYLVELLPHFLFPTLAGHLGLAELDAIGLYLAGDYLLGKMVSNSICYVFQGLESQACGANDFTAARVIFQRTLLIGLVFYLVIGIPLLLNSSLIFILFGQRIEISKMAGNALVITIPGYILWFLGELLFRLYLAQMKIKQVVLISTLYGASLVLFQIAFVFILRFGFYGIPIGATLSLVTFSIIVLISNLIDSSQAPYQLFKIQSNCLENCGEMTKNYVYSLCQIGIYRFSNESCTFLAGRLGKKNLPHRQF